MSQGDGTENRVEIGGTLTELEPLRHTPAGVAIVRFTIAHESVRVEAGVECKIGCEIAVVAVEREARLVASAALGTRIFVRGFLSRRSRNARSVVLHAEHIEYATNL